MDDAPALAELAATTFPLACPPTTTAEAIADHIANALAPEVLAGWIVDPQKAVMVAESSDGSLDGYALAVFGPCADPEAAIALATAGIVPDPVHELSKIYVRAEAQGGGLAGALMEAAVAASREAHGAGPFWLGTNADNARAQAFYRRHGFATVGARTFLVGGRPESDVVMLRTE
ncbi:GNAT family N-acetyltransferase [Demequina sp. SYSU T00039]|uniref:GNAT family N-acetyltransferase n=1 Tax=Demequina lignilytica TaxID=3051663 RepID=A0AAW7M934_9MICO|nr:MULTISPECIES: GNAT family N-acetyltransferase [unclassified Demequina]MDN4477763.1 GNAT family N-acetyltransferase [Demequina sp. SYSU T00039-1]MDN4487672.1 GNAT family N-acetyltransferase [Demequina sp. SYSU T00039]MDN4491383.1 GNAT family N-acetyltransferase [Demequina sp. SYSU T00068]